MDVIKLVINNLEKLTYFFLMNFNVFEKIFKGEKIDIESK